MRMFTTTVFGLLMTAPALSQVSNPSIIPIPSTPSGACAQTIPLELKTPDGTLYSCQNGTWTQLGGGVGTVNSAAQFSVYGQQNSGTQAIASAIPSITADGSGNFLSLSSQPKVSPVADIRANGAVIDGTTDILAALNTSIAQCNTVNANSCTVLLPCTGPNGCYLANGSGLVWSPAGHQVLHIVLQGTLYLGSTLVTPSFVSLTCDGGGAVGQFQFAGPTCAIQGKTQVTGTVGTAITTVGSPVTFTPTFTAGSAANFQVNSAITIAGLQTCSATASRTSAANGPNTIFTLTGCTDSSGNAETMPATPNQSTVTVTGCSDSTFNITGGVVNAQDWPNNQESIFESGSTATATGCTVVGFDSSTFETVQITGVSGSVMTATFAHKHAASDVLGMVTVAPAKSSFHADFESANINSMGGAAMWLYDTNAINLSGNTFNTTIGSGITEFPLECAGCFLGSWDKNSFVLRGPTPFNCTSGCSSGYPWSIRLTQEAAASNQGVGGAFIAISNSTITGGIKVDANGVAAINGVGPEIGPLTNDVFEQTTNGAITVDPSFNLGGPISVSMNSSFLQDNQIHNAQYYFAGLSCCVSGFADLGDVPSFNSAASNISNIYWPSHIQAKNANTMLNPGSLENSTGLLTSGDTLLGNFAGANAGQAPNIVPQTTLAVTLNPSCATCSSITGPDGVANSAVEVQKNGGSKVFLQIGSTSTGTYPGDMFIFGSYCKPGTGTNVWSGLLLVQTQGTDRFLANSSFPITGTSASVTGNGMVPLTSGTWQRCFQVGVIATGESTAHSVIFDLESPNAGTNTGNDFYDPFWLYVIGPNNPSYVAGVSTTPAEAIRWAEEMFKGYVPSAAATGNLYYNPAYTLNGGPIKTTAATVGGGSTINAVNYYSTASIAPTAVTAATCSDQTFTVTGLATGDKIGQVIPPGALGNVGLTGYVSATNTVLLHFCNPSILSVTPPAGVYSFVDFR